jgi:hypothetical protein
MVMQSFARRVAEQTLPKDEGGVQSGNLIRAKDRL